MSIGTYNGGKVKDGQFRISPSSINTLSDNELAWYKSNVLKQSTFKGNTATRLGTYVHYLIEQTLKNTPLISDDDVITWLVSQDEEDMWRVLEDGKAMYEVWLEEYKITGSEKVEHWLEYEPNDKIIFSGTADVIDGDTCLDWKTTKTKKSSIGDYWTQLYHLSFIARQQGHTINNIAIGYLIAPTKTLGARYIEVREPIDEDKMEYFIEWLKLKARKIRTAIDGDYEMIMSRNLLSYRT